MKPTVLERFLAKVSPEPNSGCWFWTGFIDDSGYGLFRFNGKTRGAHRVSWILHHGEIPAGLFICHRCDVRYCVNPAHLFLGTVQENQADMRRKGRSPRGSKSPRVKLCPAHVLHIKSLLAQGELKTSEIARRFNVSASAIWHIKRGANWRHLQQSTTLPPDAASYVRHSAAPKENKLMSDFHQAFEFTMQHEDSTRSGRVTTDAGGRTRFGIAEKFHRDLPEEYFTGPIEAALAIVEMIERKQYWEPMRLGQIENQNIANKLFDMAVNMGTHQAAVYAQRGANGLLQTRVAQPPSAGDILTEDGVIGEKTLATINSLDPIRYHQVLCELSAAHYRHVAALNPAQAVNLAGWLKRAEA